MDGTRSNTSHGQLNDEENTSSLLNMTSYSLHDASTENESLEKGGLGLLDKTILDILDHPYSQLQDRLHLRNSDQYGGFDNNTGGSWIYPTNYPIRQYQFTITKEALFKNTLVVLPTGLGKTFIAAVVMYNIFRWYPTGKVIFMAPTRPLVSQQIEACYRIMGIPKIDTVEITGKQQRKNRTALWQTKRVFYATPQVVLADLMSNEQCFPVEQVRLVVFDEAHKAKGRYAYTEVMKAIGARNSHFRVLALSATPGRTLEDVAEVIKNLLISHIEVRWENSIDVMPYTFRKDIRTIVIPLGQTIRSIREQLLKLVDPYFRRLLEMKIFSRYPSTLTRGILIMELKRFRGAALQQRHPNHSAIIADFSVCVSMYHAAELLVRHGIRALINFFADGGQNDGSAENHEKYFVARDPQIKSFLEQLRKQYSPVENGAEPESITGNDDIDFGHPKFRILEKQLTLNFKERPNSKAIVFCEFRDSVATINRILSLNQPLIRSKCIVGHGGTGGIRAVTQREQLATMQQFRSGTCNTLVATCVAEEGIDVGEVDLIVCFDVANNPIRYVQRIGRTGRQRVGRVLMLVTAGEEHETLKKVLASKDKTNQELARSKYIMRILYRNSPRLVPNEFEPKCVEMYINIPEDQTKKNDSSDDGSHQAVDRGAEGRKTRKKVLERALETTESVHRKQRKTVLMPGQRDVRQFLERTQSCVADDLNTSVFSPQSPVASNVVGPQGANKSFTTPIDKYIRKGRTDEEMAIAKRLKPLMHHYGMLSRQKFIKRQQLLNVPTVEQILLRMSLSVIHKELIRSLLPTGEETFKEVAPPKDNPIDLQELEAYDHQPIEAPTEESQSLQNASISNMFDSTANFIDLPVVAMTSSSVTHCKSNDSSSEQEQYMPVNKESKRQKTSYEETNNSQSLFAFYRPVQKQKHIDIFDTPVRSRGSTAASTRVLTQIKCDSLQAALEYFHLRSIEDIFDNNDESDVAFNRDTMYNSPTVSDPNFSDKTIETVTDRVSSCKSLEKHFASPELERKCSLDVEKKDFNLGSAAMVFEDELMSEDEGNDGSINNMPIVTRSGNATNQVEPSKNLIKPKLYRLRLQTTKQCDSPADKSAVEKTPFGINCLSRGSPALTVANEKRIETECVTKSPIVDKSSFSVGSNESPAIGHKARRVQRNRTDSNTESDERTFTVAQETCDWKAPSSTAERPTERTSDRTSKKQIPMSTKQVQRRRKVKPRVAAFFHSQAEVSADENNSSDADANQIENSPTMLSFITQTETDEEETSAIDMRAVYLQSVRSPIVRRNGFKLAAMNCQDKSLPGRCIPGEVSDDDYHEQDDSFIDNDEAIVVESQLCELEQAERQLRDRRWIAKRTRTDAEEELNSRQKKRRRKILALSSDSD